MQEVRFRRCSNLPHEVTAVLQEVNQLHIPANGVTASNLQEMVQNLHISSRMPDIVALYFLQDMYNCTLYNL
jgi:hypothetical protein